VIRNAWAFRVDPQRWVPAPLPPKPGDDAQELRCASHDLAGTHSKRSNEHHALPSEHHALPSEHCAQCRSPEAARFLPIDQPGHVLTCMDTDAANLVRHWACQWSARGPRTRAVDVIDLDGALTDAQRIVHIDVDEHGQVQFHVAFWGTDGDIGTMWHGQTENALVAGQFMALGAELFATVHRRDGASSR